MSRIILKISGEALKKEDTLVATENLNIVLKTVEMLKARKHNIGIVVGGGNFFRGREHNDMDKIAGDTIGMLGTIMNSLYIKDFLETNNIKTTISTPFLFPDLIDSVSDKLLLQKYNDGEVIIFGGGIGKSGFSTDSGTILASEKLHCDLIIKMTNVNGVYDSDPKTNPNAIKFDKLTFDEVIKKDYKVMDQYAFNKCKEYGIKILVINFSNYENIEKYFNGETIGTVIEG